MLRRCSFFALVCVLVLSTFLPGCCSDSAAESSPPRTAIDAQPLVREDDFDRLIGTPWTGTLTYLDYTSMKSATIRSTLAVARLPQSESGPAWDLRVGYNDAPHANSREALVLLEGGRRLGTASVVERTLLAGGLVAIATERQGEDDGQPATLRHVYLLGASECSIQNLVMLDDSDESFERNLYRWSR